MITCTGREDNYGCSFTNGSSRGFADTTGKKGGGGNGFRPHELLEAAFATCLNISIRMYAEGEGLPLEEVSTAVSLRRDENGTVFEYSMELEGDLSRRQRNEFWKMVKSSPVRRTLEKGLNFEATT